MSREACSRDVVREGDNWPSPTVDAALTSLSDLVWRRVRRRLIQVRGDGSRKVGSGIAGVIRSRDHEILILPKCLVLSDGGIDGWTDSVPAILATCRNLPPWAVLPTGTGYFAASAPLLEWWAMYYSHVLERSVQRFAYLRYETLRRSEFFLRGRVNWSRQVNEWSHGGEKFACEYKGLSGDNVVNQLLHWAAYRFLAIASNKATRRRLQGSLELIESSGFPSRPLVDRIRISRAAAVYREPVEIARALYDSQYPSLTPGHIPASALLLEMVAVFESFVDGLVFRVTLRGQRMGRKWRYGRQSQELLASAVVTGRDFYTRPDNIIAFGADADPQDRGVVIDAKYKGVVRDQGRPYERPTSGDLYQVLASCVARGWRKGIVIAPSSNPISGSGIAMRSWTIADKKIVGEIEITLINLDLRRMSDTTYMDAIEDKLFSLVARHEDEDYA